MFKNTTIKTIFKKTEKAFDKAETAFEKAFEAFDDVFSNLNDDTSGVSIIQTDNMNVKVEGKKVTINGDVEELILNGKKVKI